MTSTGLPADSWDCHFHVFGDSRLYAFAEARAYTPAQRSIADYWSMFAPLGVARAVLVQPSVYGFDNRLLLDHLDLDRERLRGVAVVPADTGQRALSRLHDRGVRAIRLNPRLPSGLSLADGVAHSPRLADAGLHLQLQPSPGDIDRLGALLDAVAVPVVLDHTGFPDLSCADGLRTRDILLRLLEHDRLWLKLAAPYRFKVPMTDNRIVAYSRALTAARPDRMLWGSDWPHPEHDLIDADTRTIVASAPDWFADAEALRAACCLNPPELFA